MRAFHRKVRAQFPFDPTDSSRGETTMPKRCHVPAAMVFAVLASLELLAQSWSWARDRVAEFKAGVGI
jgi:hypothetical protein